MIQPGLERIGLLLRHTPLPWKAIHVAGTNGKGSICANASTLLARHANVRCGRFTSPHLIDRWDCITIDDVPVKKKLFREVEDKYLQYSASEGIRASEFEVLTATAFDIFTREKVDVGVVEVGMGGRLDATNILESPLVTVISKISLDHQSWLGSTIEEIALAKAGILKPGVPCVVDHTNERAVKNVIKAVAEEIGAGPLIYTNSMKKEWDSLPNWKQVFDSMQPHQQANAIAAYLAVCESLKSLGKPSLVAEDVIPGLKQVQWPGRLEKIQLKSIIGSDPFVLLDGAHNADSARVLGDYVNNTLRPSLARSGKPKPITWVLAMTEGKDMEEIFRGIGLEHADNVVTVEFGPIDGMPWVRPTDGKALLAKACYMAYVQRGKNCGKDLVKALLTAKEFAAEGNQPIVIAGSLYLASDVLRLIRDYQPGDENQDTGMKSD